MPNILYLHNHSDISGGERSLLNLWQHLNPTFKKFVILPDEGPLATQAKNIDVDVTINAFPKLSLLNFFKIQKTITFLKNFIKEHDINIVHSYSPRNNLIAAFSCKPLNIPVIWHERNLLNDKEPDQSKQFITLPSAIICNSNAVAERFKQNGIIPAKVQVIINGVDINIFRSNLAHTLKIKYENNLEEYKIVGSFGNLNIRKRPEYLLSIAESVIKKIPKTKFLIVGDQFPQDNGERIQQLKNLTKSMHLENNIIFTGFVENVIDYINACDLIVHVAKKEACGRSIIEAQACGKPVIALADGGNPELIKNAITGILISQDTVENFTNNIYELLRNDDLRHALGQHARMHAGKFFDITKNTRQTEFLYEQLLEKVKKTN
ncbi:MAG: glycosyltransferase family 4 protein [Candidatus Omnitrophica bacterium]|nr:glycosyltransferase family 4 protein [Candidatus Omnitrophota bacterium]